MTHAMETVAAFLKFALRPASVNFIVAALGLGVLLAWSRRTWRIAPFYWLLLLVGYTALATPVISDWLVEQTSGGYPRLERAADGGFDLVAPPGAQFRPDRWRNRRSRRGP